MQMQQCQECDKSCMARITVDGVLAKLWKRNLKDRAECDLEVAFVTTK